MQGFDIKLRKLVYDPFLHENPKPQKPRYFGSILGLLGPKTPERNSENTTQSGFDYHKISVRDHTRVPKIHISGVIPLHSVQKV